MPDITVADRKLAQVLWDYHVLHQTLPPRADVVLVAGSHDLRVADRAAELMLCNLAPISVTSGGFGKVTAETNSRPEGEIFRDRMIELGVPEEMILAEQKARNTGDNFQLSEALLASVGVEPKVGVVVTKPYMERRALATGMKQWSGVDWFVTSPSVAFEDYATDDVPERRMIDLMVGDLQRIDVFAEKGFQMPQEIPPAIWSAYHELVARGFDSFVMPSSD